MAWTIGSVQIFPTSIDDAFGQTIARLQPLASGTIYHVFGYEDDIKKMSAYIVGSADRLALIDYTRDATTHDLYNNTSFWGAYYIKNIAFKFEPIAYQTIRPDLACTDTVYTIEMELYKNE
jgi:hypothetical protein